MHNELTDLLPADRQAKVARYYFLRFLAVALWFVAALAAIGVMLLVPTYILLVTNAQAKQAYLDSIGSSVTSEADSLSSRIALLNGEAAALDALTTSRSASALIRQMLAIPRPGIVLNNFAYTPANGTKPGTLVISGVASARDTLRNYQLAVQNAAFSKTASLPVSAYAQDSNIGFSITVTLAP
ncbi:MAG TPA: hypothetical protein VFP46_00950 [Candidatus Paceibacterota bacterium]|nr:hypothetical protein [Candidatus Paceibacterota bacterium]